jgi:hypothetical protein
MHTLKQYRLALQIFQSHRLRRDYSDLAALPEYRDVGEFFFTELYGPHDFSERDADAQRLQHFLHLVPGVRLHDVEQILDLLSTTVALDNDLADLLLTQQLGLDFDEPAYERAYRAADNYATRQRQLELVHSTLHNVFQLSRSQLLGFGLRSSGLIARMAGFEAGHRFLLKGYEALHDVRSIDHFATTIYNRELARLNRIYER